MSFFESFRIALRALQANKLRSFLTMLGIIIGVASVVSMVAFGVGAQREIADQIRTLGAHVLMIEPGAIVKDGARTETGSRANLSETDAAAVAGQIQSVVATAPSVRGTVQVVHGNRNVRVKVNGTVSDYFLIREWPLKNGRYFSRGEQASAGKVALIGQSTVKHLFGGENPVGQQIRIMTVPFKIIGVLEEKGTSGAGRDQDNIVFIPISTAKKRLIGSANSVKRDSVAYILVKSVSAEAVPVVERRISALLRQRHRLRSGVGNDFTISNPAAIMAAQHAAKRTIGWLLAGIASVSLIVGGISIMNIMLVSVTERTREIGLRIAVGARQKDVQSQFLMEALVLCSIGGMIGLFAGAIVAIAVAQMVGWPIFLSPGAMLGSVVMAGLVGLFFGYFPARRASRLNPVEALRAE
jgi:putative ABC transport system permease protein